MSVEAVQHRIEFEHNAEVGLRFMRPEHRERVQSAIDTFARADKPAELARRVFAPNGRDGYVLPADPFLVVLEADPDGNGYLVAGILHKDSMVASSRQTPETLS